MLNKEDSPKKIMQRITRILVVLVVGSFCYYVYYAWYRGTPFSIKEFLINLPRTQVTTAYWYLYLYLGLLFLLPILQRLVKTLNKRSLEYLLFLSIGILGTAPLIKLSPLFISGLIGVYIGQVLLGYYIERYLPLTKKVFWICFFSFIFLITIQVAGTFLLYLQNPTSFLKLDDRTLITITLTAACFYICVKYIFAHHPPKPKLEKVICRIGSLTFGIYLLLDMAIVQTLSIYISLKGIMHPFAAIVLWELIIFVICAIITAVLRLVPPLRKWI